MIEERILQKKPSARPDLEGLWKSYQQQVCDIAHPPGLELGSNYPTCDQKRFVRDYPFLPYQIPAAADVFGGMRGVKVTSGAHTMIGVAFDATRTLAGQALGAIVSWDQIFDAANRDNEFADEQYLGGQGLTYIRSADHEVTGAPLQPSRVLKTLWLIQQRPRIPRTTKNLTRLLVDRLDADVLRLEQDVSQTLQGLEKHSFVRQEVGTGQWRFLNQEEVTLEKIVSRIGGDIKQKEMRDEIFKLDAQQLQGAYNGRITAGKSNTSFEYGIYLNDTPLKNEGAQVRLCVVLEGSKAATQAREASASDLEAPAVYWVVGTTTKLEERLRRAMAIERLPSDEEYRQVATARTKVEADRLGIEAGELHVDAAAGVERALRGGALYWAGNALELDSGQPGAARPKVEEALRDRIGALYVRFREGDRQFNTANVDKLFTVPESERGALDPNLGLFSSDGHVHSNNVLVEALSAFLKEQHEDLRPGHRRVL